MDGFNVILRLWIIVMNRFVTINTYLVGPNPYIWSQAMTLNKRFNP